MRNLGGNLDKIVVKLEGKGKTGEELEYREKLIEHLENEFNVKVEISFNGLLSSPYNVFLIFKDGVISFDFDDGPGAKEIVEREIEAFNEDYFS